MSKVRSCEIAGGLVWDIIRVNRDCIVGLVTKLVPLYIYKQSN